MKFSSTAQDALAASKSYAEEFKSRYAGTEHLLLGLIESRDDVLDQTFYRLDVDRDHLKDVVISILSIEETNKLFKSDAGPAFTPRVLRIIDFAKGLAQKLEKTTVDVIHLFLSLLYENDGVATSILMEYGLNFDNVIDIAKISYIKELNIGHFLIGESIFIGLSKSIKKFKKIIK